MRHVGRLQRKNFIIVCSLVGIATANRRYHAGFAVLMFTWQIYWSFSYYDVMQ